MTEATITAMALLRPFRFVAVGVAWSAPLLSLCFLDPPYDGFAYPQLAQLLAPLRWELLLVSPVLVVAGIAIVAWLSAPPPPSRTWTVLPLPLIALFLLAAAALSFIAVLMIIVVQAVLTIGGAVVTIVVLWRRRWWLAVLWSVLWLAALVFFWLATAQSAENLWGGMLAFVVSVALLLTSLVVGAIASLLTSPRVRAAMAQGIDGAEERGPLGPTNR